MGQLVEAVAAQAGLVKDAQGNLGYPKPKEPEAPGLELNDALPVPAPAPAPAAAPSAPAPQAPAAPAPMASVASSDPAVTGGPAVVRGAVDRSVVKKKSLLGN